MSLSELFISDDPTLLFTHRLNLFPLPIFFSFSDGQVLIEDLRSGGAFATQSSTFHLHTKNEKRKHNTKVPDVVVSGEDPTIDFRTIIELNMMGI